MTKIRFTPRRLALGCLLVVLGLGIQGSQAADLKFRVQLVWGTNDDKAKDPPAADKISFDDDNAKASANNDKRNIIAKDTGKVEQAVKSAEKATNVKGDSAKPEETSAKGAAPSSEEKAKKAADEKNQKPPLKEVDPQLAANLRKIFTWKHYYEVFRKEPVMVGNAVVKVTVSEKCEIELKNLAKPILEVKLIGEGKLVKTAKQPVTPEQYLVIGGDGKDDTAWFIVISPY